VAAFTTIGPLVCDGYTITSGDTVPHSGDRLKLVLSLSNDSKIKTAKSITATAVNLDTSSYIYPLTVSFGDIKPGEIDTTRGIFTISFIGNSVFTDLKIDILSNGIHFWSDTISIWIEPTGIEDQNVDLPHDFILEQNYPNPFNPVTTIAYQLPKTCQVDLSIYNLLGQKVATLVSAKQPAGNYLVQWDASGFASGIYIYQLQTDKDFVQTRKLVLLK